MNYPSMKRAVAFASYENVVPTFVTPYGLITGKIVADQNCIDESKIGEYISPVLDQYYSKYDPPHYGAGDDGCVILADVTIRSSAGNVTHVEEMVLFCDNVIGVFFEQV